MASEVTVASAAPVPSALNSVMPQRSAPTSSDNPTIPFTVIITAANTVSLAREAASEPPASTSVTMRATSMTVTATANTSEPKGSPTRWATTSA